MSETQFGTGEWTALETPLGFGAVLGILLGVIERFVVHFDMPTLAVAFVVVGIVLLRFGDRSVVDIGQSLTVLGISGYLALEALQLVFG